MIREILSRTLGAVMIGLGLFLFYDVLSSMFSEWRWGYLLSLLAGVALGLFGLARLFPGQPPLAIGNDEPLMDAAMERAQRELGRFKQGVAEGRKEALIKYAIKTGYGENEHVWAIAHAFDGDDVVTSLASQPVGQYDDKVERKRIPEKDIEDWILINDDESLEGGFTQIAMAKIYKRDKGYVPYAIKQGLSNFVDLDDPELA